MKPPANPTPPISPEQLREARAILGWSIYRLAARSGTTRYCVIRYESFGRIASKQGKPSRFDDLISIRAAFEAAGIKFMYDDQLGVQWPKLMTQKTVEPINPHQVREARLTLGWSRQILSNVSNTTVSFIKVYEEFGRVSRLNLRRDRFDGLAVIRDAFEQAGIEFTNGDLPGVRLTKPTND